MSSVRNCVGCDLTSGEYDLSKSALTRKMFTIVIGAAQSNYHICGICYDKMESYYTFRKRVNEIIRLRQDEQAKEKAEALIVIPKREDEIMDEEKDSNENNLDMHFENGFIINGKFETAIIPEIHQARMKLRTRRSENPETNLPTFTATMQLHTNDKRKRNSLPTFNNLVKKSRKSSAVPVRLHMEQMTESIVVKKENSPDPILIYFERLAEHI